MGDIEHMPGGLIMHKITLILLMLFSGNLTAAEHFDYCAKASYVRITKIYPPIMVVGEHEKKTVIRVMLPVDCKKKKLILPSNIDHALELLDSSLPLDFKVSITKGGYINPYFYGNYGASVEEDLDSFYSSKWRLTKDAPICSAVWEKYEDYGDCFGIMLNLLRDRYISKPEQE